MTAMDEALYFELRACVEAERETGPRSSYTMPPLSVSTIRLALR